MKAFTKDGKLYKNTMQYIDDFKTPKWLKNIMMVNYHHICGI